MLPKQHQLDAMQATIERIEGMLEGLFDLKMHKQQDKATAEQGEQPPQKKSKGTMSWRGPRFREAICRVFQLGEEKEFKAEVEEEGYAVTVVGDDIMPGAKELWALLTLAMHYARIIFKESALNPDGTLQIVPGEVQGTT
ncbi:hypothetical protein HaLaN_27112, partial [Haematococcus lacustris]